MANTVLSKKKTNIGQKEKKTKKLHFFIINILVQVFSMIFTTDFD